MTAPFYSRSRLLVETVDSLLAGDRLFVGCNLDEFAAGGLLTSAREICLLGLGFGGGVRPLLSTARDARVTAVDLNDRTMRACSAVFGQYFPGARLDTVHADARDFLSDSDRSFDVVAVDLYTSDGYAEPVFNPAFWSGVRARLAPTGVLLVNAWGLPHQLGPLTGASPQRALAALLSRHFETLRAVPNRRNITFVAGADGVLGTPELGGLAAHDRAYLTMLPTRLARAGVDVAGGEFPADARVLGTIDHMQAEMERRWVGLGAAFQEAGAAVGIEPARSTLGNCVTDAVAAQMITRRLFDTDPVAARYVPVVTAAAAFGRNYHAGWFGRWLVDEFDSLVELAPAWVAETALPQAMAMALCPLAPSWDWTADLFAVAEHYATTPMSARS
jgi:hypothetical protein